MEKYTLVQDLNAVVETISPNSIVSNTFFKEKNLKSILFGFDAGEELSEHTSNQTAIIQILEGEATVTLGDDRYELKSGAWVCMPPHLKHSIYAKTPVKMLLTMIGLS